MNGEVCTAGASVAVSAQFALEFRDITSTSSLYDFFGKCDIYASLLRFSHLSRVFRAGAHLSALERSQAVSARGLGGGGDARSLAHGKTHVISRASAPHTTTHTPPPPPPPSTTFLPDRPLPLPQNAKVGRQATSFECPCRKC